MAGTASIARGITPIPLPALTRGASLDWYSRQRRYFLAVGCWHSSCTFLSVGMPVALAATARRQCRRLMQAHEGVVDSKSLTGPLIAFEAKMSAGRVARVKSRLCAMLSGGPTR